MKLPLSLQWVLMDPDTLRYGRKINYITRVISYIAYNICRYTLRICCKTTYKFLMNGHPKILSHILLVNT